MSPELTILSKMVAQLNDTEKQTLTRLLEPELEKNEPIPSMSGEELFKHKCDEHIKTFLFKPK